MNERYKVWTGKRGKIYDTLAEAAKAADDYRGKTGYIVAVTTVKRRTKSCS